MMLPRSYRKAEGRLRESIKCRAGGIWNHTYPGREEDLKTLRLYHAEHGIPERGLLAGCRRIWEGVHT